jgi:hypothetical protein
LRLFGIEGLGVAEVEGCGRGVVGEDGDAEGDAVGAGVGVAEVEGEAEGEAEGFGVGVGVGVAADLLGVETIQRVVPGK